MLHVGCVETQIQYTILLEDKHETVAVNIDAGICNNGLADELWNCEISGFPLRLREVFGVLSRYTAYVLSCLPTFRDISVPSSTLIIFGLLHSA